MAGEMKKRAVWSDAAVMLTLSEAASRAVSTVSRMSGRNMTILRIGRSACLTVV